MGLFACLSLLDWSDYVGRIAVGRIESGKLIKGNILRSTSDGSLCPAKTTGLQVFDKLGRVDTDEAIEPVTLPLSVELSRSKLVTRFAARITHSH